MSTPEKDDLMSTRDSITALARSVGAQREGVSGRPIKVRYAVVRDLLCHMTQAILYTMNDVHLQWPL